MHKLLNSLSNILDELLNCNVTRSLVSNQSTLGAFCLLLHDSFIIFKLKRDAILILVGLYYS